MTCDLSPLDPRDQHESFATRNKCIATSNKCLTSSNKNNLIGIANTSKGKVMSHSSTSPPHGHHASAFGPVRETLRDPEPTSVRAKREWVEWGKSLERKESLEQIVKLIEFLYGFSAERKGHRKHRTNHKSLQPWRSILRDLSIFWPFWTVLLQLPLTFVLHLFRGSSLLWEVETSYCRIPWPICSRSLCPYHVIIIYIYM